MSETNGQRSKAKGNTSSKILSLEESQLQSYRRQHGWRPGNSVPRAEERGEVSDGRRNPQ